MTRTASLISTANLLRRSHSSSKLVAKMAEISLALLMAKEQKNVEASKILRKRLRALRGEVHG